MRPGESLAVDILLQDAFTQHQAEIAPGAAPRRVGRLVDDVPQIVEAAGVGRLAGGNPAFARLAALPGAGREAEDLDLDAAALQRAGENVGAHRRDAEGAVDRVLGRAAARLGAGPAGAAGIVVAGAGHHLAIRLGLAVFLGIGIGAVGRRAIHRGLRPGRGAFTAVALVLALGLLALALIFVRGRLVELAEIEIEILDP